MPYSGEPESWGHVLQRKGVRVESIGKLHYRNETDSVGFDKEHLPMHVVGGYGMVWASIRDPYITGPGGKRMLVDRVGGDFEATQILPTSPRLQQAIQRVAPAVSSDAATALLLLVAPMAMGCS